MSPIMIKIYFDWEQCRTREGYYRLRSGTPYCIQRARAYAPFADLIWMETSKPNIKQAKVFADGVKVCILCFISQDENHQLTISFLHYKTQIYSSY